ncbi:hypothetical protein E2C01_019807 [Portunus trituberculatus]|uniref:Uncharacterized protein n=1 Tax=Portunus trituberculatus TaxID=210409 RepID=A0A5B7DYM6_PORTR|nr:hypothetical protein [Portunus trituberculatus]
MRLDFQQLARHCGMHAPHILRCLHVGTGTRLDHIAPSLRHSRRFVERESLTRPDNSNLPTLIVLLPMRAKRRETRRCCWHHNPNVTYSIHWQKEEEKQQQQQQQQQQQ